MARKGGVLPRQTLKDVAESGCITGISDEQLNPASIDLPVGEEFFRVENSFLPQGNERVHDLLKHPHINAVSHDPASPMEVGVTYFARVDGTFALPSGIYGYCNPKSSTGRVGALCRVVADGVALYDAVIPGGWHGDLWVSIRPDSFPIRISPGTAVSQLRLFDEYTVLDRLEIELAAEHTPLLYKPNNMPYGVDGMHIDGDGSFFLTLDLESDCIGYRCRHPSKVLDLSKRKYDPGEFFEPVFAEGDCVRLKKGEFYILSTHELVCVPPQFSAELRPIDVRLGDMRTHAAGYVDPGWGWGKSGEVRGRALTLEVVPYENILVRRGQVVARIRYERMRDEPDVSYDAAASNYIGQTGATLSKHFNPWPEEV